MFVPPEFDSAASPYYRLYKENDKRDKRAKLQVCLLIYVML